MLQTPPSSPQTIRVVLCAYPGIFADTVIKVLQETRPIELVGLVYSQRIFSARESWLGSAVRLIKLAGIKYALLQLLQTDLYLLLRKISRYIPAEAAVPVHPTKNINTQAGLDFLQSLNPDVVLLANFNQKISPAVIALPKLACLNIHPSLLPCFKGVDPVFAALFAEVPYLGVTVHQVDEDFDTGEIIAQTMLPTNKNDSVFYHQLQLFHQGAKLATHVITQLPQGMTKPVQNEAGHYDSWPTRTKIRDFNKRGGRLIKYSEYIEAVKRLFCV